MSEFFRKSLYRRSPPRLLAVKRVTQVSPSLLSLTLTGEGLDDFPTHCPAAHVKLFLPRPGQDRPTLPTLGPDGPLWPADQPKPLIRTYSVRSFRLGDREIDIEFALHPGVEGPATRFARQAQPGDFVGLSYPGGPDPMIPPASHYYLAGDLSTVPALASILEQLPTSARGAALVRVDDARDIRDLRRPSGVELRWFVADPTAIGELVQAFRALPLPADAFCWIGGEHSLVVSLREYLTGERGISKDALYALPYWRHCFDEEGYHQLRDQVMNQETVQ